ncbi:hypothetical protein CPJCM30710_03550 [Clostridium polyendosporum]|uniref:Uncharacterized protein n=1 Tax=Clostridium polyendosporum TaxID=69208 RepID=A0A919VD74_9CLOT|nr:glycosyltransferase [Clostridium polyendosporum]GIM27689.1 hypothetical protein CPJCM30710_03550 [Clostridium polyendosporum]
MYYYERQPGLVSVVIPTYNRAQYICDALDGLKKQTYKNIEVILIDDCSTDDTEDVIKKWSEENRNVFADFIYLKLPRNRDEWWAWNIGFYLAKGEYIVIHSSDDISSEDRIKKQVDYLISNIDTAAVGSSYKSFNENIDNIIGVAEWLIYDSDSIERSYKEKFEHCVCSGTLMFRADILDTIIGFKKVTNNLNDYYLIEDIINNDYVISNINENLYYVREHEGQKSKKLEDANKITDGKYLPEALKTIESMVSTVIVLENELNSIIDILDSIAYQTYKNIELIIIDNTLDNNIQNTINEWWFNKKDKKNVAIKEFIYFKLPRIISYPWTYNIGAYLAKGEYIAFHGEDRISNRGRIQKQVEYLNENFLTSVVGTNFGGGSNFVKYDEDIEYSYIVDYMPCVNINTIMLRTRIINETGGLNRKILGRESFEFIYRLLNKGHRVQNLREVLYDEPLSDEPKEEIQTLPLVSIIMPVHNCEKYIVESINSILSQTYKNLELIIVDTGSDDRTYDLIDQIKDERIKVIRTSSDKGLTYAFFSGLKVSSGDFITRHDPDDTSTENRIKNQVEYLLSNKDLDMVSCLIKCTTDVQKYKKACLFIERLQNYYVDSKTIEKAILGDFIPIVFPTLLIRRELINKINVPEEPEEFDDQIGLLLELLKQSKVEKINKILYNYRRHDKAYHLINEQQYYNYTIESIAASDIKGHIIYREFIIKKPENISKLNNESSIRVLILVDALNLGGTETHVLHLVKKLIDMGIYVVVGTSGGPLTTLFQYNGIKIFKIPLNTEHMSNKKLFSCIKLVKEIIDTEKINLLHAHLFTSMSIASEINKRYNIPYVTTIHGLFYPNDVLFNTCFNTNAIIPVSKPVERLLVRKLGNQVKSKLFGIANGVTLEDYTKETVKTNIREELNIAPNDLVITYCSRLAWQKTFAAESFIFGFNKLANKYDNIHAIIIGDGDGKEMLQREANMLNSCLERDAFHVVGAKHNVIDYYMISDIVIGTGRVALEAMSCKKPVIAIGNSGYVGIVSEQNKDIQWQTYFGDHDSIKEPDPLSLYEDMKYLATNYYKRIEIGNWGRQWCEEMFNIDKAANRTLSVYKRILNNS